MSEHDANHYLAAMAEQPRPRIPRRPPPADWSTAWAAGVALATILLVAWAIGPQVLKMMP